MEVPEFVTVGEAAAVLRIGQLLRRRRAGLEASAGGALHRPTVEATASSWPATEIFFEVARCSGVLGGLVRTRRGLWLFRIC